MRTRDTTRLFSGWRGCLLWLGWCSAVAQAQYRFDHWTADNGLPQNTVRDIVQTRDGYLWLTTLDGLVRFDGVRFTVFNKSNTPGIISNRFQFLYEDAQGNLWASTENSGLTRLHAGRFISYTTAPGLPDSGVRGLSGDGQGNLLVFSASRLFRWAGDKFLPADDLRLPTGAAASEWRNKATRLSCNIDHLKRMACFADGQLRSWTLADLPPEYLDFAPIQDRHGSVWFFSAQGLIKMEQGRVVRVYTPGRELPGAPIKLVYGRQPLQLVSRGADGSLWLTDLEAMQSHLVAQQPSEGLATILLCYDDREGNYWFGTLRDGLYCARRQSITAYSKAQGLKAEEVYPLCEDRAGTIWIGTGGGGLFSFAGGAFTHYDSASSLGNYITSLAQDRAGQLWINGAWRFEHGRFVRGIELDVLPDSLRLIWTRHEDHAGTLWFGAEKGVVRYRNGVATHYTTKDGLAGDDTKVIIDDAAGGLWLGSYGGLTHYQDGRFTKWTESDGLPGNTVRALYQDDDGSLWIGTYDSGLGRFKDGRFTRYTARDGLYDGGVFQILEDAQGWFWMSCNRGLYRVRKQELNDFAAGKIKTITSIAYGKSDGMLNVECNGGRSPAGIRARDGKLWFPTMGGVVVVDPKTVNTNPQPPPVLIEELLVDRQPTRFAGGVRIRPEQENFEIQYTALSFVNSEHLKFKYRLAGLDHDWIEAGTRRTAYYSHVAPGDYVFQVLAANRDGVWNTEGQSLRITVLPPFYRTWWFTALVSLSALGAGALLYRYRVAQLRRAHATREAFSQQLLAAQAAFSRRLIDSQEAERKRLAGELHDSLSQNLVIIKNRAMLTLQEPAAPEQTVEQIEGIAEAADHALAEVRALAQNLRPFHIDRLGLTKAIEALVRKAGTNGLQLTARLDKLDGLLASELEINLYRIVQESLNNIVKHARASHASVIIERHEQTITATIQDNGRGFVPGATRLGESQNGSGLGLVGLHERARMLGSVLVLESAPGRGTKIQLQIDLNQYRAQS